MAAGKAVAGLILLVRGAAGTTPMMEPRNRFVRVRRFGGPEELEVADASPPTAGRGEVRVRVLASSLNYTDVLIRRHLYPQTARRRPPFVLGYDVVGEADQAAEIGRLRRELDRVRMERDILKQAALIFGQATGRR